MLVMFLAHNYFTDYVSHIHVHCPTNVGFEERSSSRFKITRTKGDMS